MHGQPAAPKAAKPIKESVNRIDIAHQDRTGTGSAAAKGFGSAMGWAYGCATAIISMIVLCCGLGSVLIYPGCRTTDEGISKSTDDRFNIPKPVEIAKNDDGDRTNQANGLLNAVTNPGNNSQATQDKVNSDPTPNPYGHLPKAAQEFLVKYRSECEKGVQTGDGKPPRIRLKDIDGKGIVVGRITVFCKEVLDGDSFIGFEVVAGANVDPSWYKYPGNQGDLIWFQCPTKGLIDDKVHEIDGLWEGHFSQRYKTFLESKTIARYNRVCESPKDEMLKIFTEFAPKPAPPRPADLWDVLADSMLFSKVETIAEIKAEEKKIAAEEGRIKWDSTARARIEAIKKRIRNHPDILNIGNKTEVKRLDVEAPGGFAVVLLDGKRYFAREIDLRR